MNYSVILLIVGMALVTYIPRALPAIVIERLKFNTRVEKFLHLIPYTAMAAPTAEAVVFKRRQTGTPIAVPKAKEKTMALYLTSHSLQQKALPNEGFRCKW